jgi:hypothetical protein
MYPFRAKLRCIAVTSLLLGASTLQAATILTFDVTGIANFNTAPPAYGDNVSGASDATGSYGTTNGVYTPNVTVAYGSPGEDPSLWTTGFGDLTNIQFNDLDGDTTLTITWTADPGYQVTLLSFDLASFVSGGQTLANPAITISDGLSNVLWTQTGPQAVSGATHNSFAPGVTASELRLVVNLTGLGSLSDDVGIDNIAFSQSAQSIAPVPEPGTLWLTIGAAGLLWRWKRTRI